MPIVAQNVKNGPRDYMMFETIKCEKCCSKLNIDFFMIFFTLNIQVSLAGFAAEGVDKLADDVSAVLLVEFSDVQGAHVAVILDACAPGIAQLYAILEPASAKSGNSDKCKKEIRKERKKAG